MGKASSNASRVVFSTLPTVGVCCHIYFPESLRADSSYGQVELDWGMFMAGTIY